MAIRLAISSQRGGGRGVLAITRLLACLLLVAPLFEVKAENAATVPLVITGDFRPGGLLFGHSTVEQAIFYKKTRILVSPEGRFVIGLDRDHRGDLRLEMVQKEAETVSQIFEIQPREYRIQSIQGVAHKYIAPDPEQRARTQAESKRVRHSRQHVSHQDDFFDGFIWPARGPITGVFGSQRIFNGEPRRPHYGLDIAGPVGAAVIAPAAGTVRLVEDLFFSGWTLVMDHGHGLSSSFLHLSDIMVDPGESVEQGQLIARIGATGRVTGPHLDWRMNWQLGAFSARVDPEQLVKIGENKADLNN